MNSPTLHVTRAVQVPFPAPFRHAVDVATERAFIGRKMITTLFGETVLLEDVKWYNERAEQPLASAFEKLASIGRDDVISVIQELYPRLIPYFIGCGTKNPVHHTANVLECMAEILICEQRTDKRTVTVGMLAVLFHDAAQGLSKLKKITEKNLKDKCIEVANGNETLDGLAAYLDDALRARKEHMQDGARIAGERLSVHRQESGLDLPDEDIFEIQRIIAHHDDPKLPVAYRVLRSMFADDPVCQRWRSALSSEDERRLSEILAKDGGEYLLNVYDWLLQCHHEADLLWMVTPHGIEADLARFSPAEGKTHRELVHNNIREHRREVELYCDLENFAAYGFQNGTAYRTSTGYSLFQDLTDLLNQEYPVWSQTK